MAIRGGLVFAMLVVVAGIVVVPRIKAQCGGNYTAIFEQCGMYIRKDSPDVPPSQACCTELQNHNITCSCEYIGNNPGIFERQNISLAKTVNVSRTCGNSIEAGTMCGDYTIPPESSPVPEE